MFNYWSYQNGLSWIGARGKGGSSYEKFYFHIFYSDIYLKFTSNNLKWQTISLQIDKKMVGSNVNYLVPTGYRYVVNNWQNLANVGKERPLDR